MYTNTDTWLQVVHTYDEHNNSAAVNWTTKTHHPLVTRHTQHNKHSDPKAE